MEIWTLSGFLGLPQDWNFLQMKNLKPVDWQGFPLDSLTDWGAHFNHLINQQSRHPKILMGYSLGGRLALHALIQQPQLWKAAIIISAHTGFIHSHDRQKRLEQDQHWANRFETENWETLMKAWNAQEVFAHDSICFDRQESDYQRFQIAKALISGSLGGQADLCQDIAALPLPILWVTGCQDTRYCQMAQKLTFSHPYSRWQSIAQAGHRAPWSQPQIFADTLTSFVHGI